MEKVIQFADIKSKADSKKEFLNSLGWETSYVEEHIFHMAIEFFGEGINIVSEQMMIGFAKGAVTYYESAVVIKDLPAILTDIDKVACKALRELQRTMKVKEFYSDFTFGFKVGYAEAYRDYPM